MFSSKDKKYSNTQHSIFTPSIPKTNQKVGDKPSPPTRNASASLIEQFFNYKNQIALAIFALEDQIIILKSHYHSYSSNPLISNTEKKLIKNSISQKLDEIYKMGNELGNTFQAANPATLFKNSKVPADDITQYQFIYDNLYISFKTVWIDLYESKEKHVAYELDLSARLLKMSYPDASKEQITAAASFMIEDDALSKNIVLMNVTDFLIHAKQRHNEIIKLEKSLHEVNQLFIDMMVLTNSQGETIDHILQNVQSAKQKVKDSVTELSDAKAALEKRSFGFSK